MALDQMIEYIENWLALEMAKEAPNFAMVRALNEELKELLAGLE